MKRNNTKNIIKPSTIEEGNKYAITASYCQDSFTEFVKVFWEEVPGSQTLTWNWHMDVLCEELNAIAQRVFKGESNIYDLLINISPGTSKSSIASILFHPWTWANMPKARHIVASHTDQLVLDLATKARSVIASQLYQTCYPFVQLTDYQDTKGYYTNTMGGDRLSCTVGGKVPTGFHAHFLCLPWYAKVTTTMGEVCIGKLVEDNLPVKVLAYDHSEEKLVWSNIESRGTSPGKPIFRVHFDNGTWLDATGNHPVFVCGKGYTNAQNLIPGDEVICNLSRENLAENPIAGKTFVVSVKPAEWALKKVYNLEVENQHNYFAEGILVHNSFDDPIDPHKARSQAEILNASKFKSEILDTRKVDKRVSVFYGIMQRISVSDPSGQMLEDAKKSGALPVRHICLPAELTDDVNPPELRLKYVNGLMDAVRLSAEALKPFKSNRFTYAGQFLQTPFVSGGSLFKPSYFTQVVKAAPYKCKRIRYWDRACQAQYTLVETINGPKYIQDIKIGDLVLTRQGYKRVKWSGETKKVNEIVSVLFSNGSVVSGTGDHRVWTENRNWVELDQLNANDCNVCIAQYKLTERKSCPDPEMKNLNQYFSTEYVTRENLTEDISTLIAGINKKRNMCTDPITGICGNSTTEVFPVAIKYTMWTKTGITTKSKILNVSTEVNMDLDTVTRCRQMQRKLGKLENQKNLSVSFAKKNSCPCAMEQMGKIDFAQNIENLPTTSNLVPVYDLEVEDAHEFYANGILVHNSTQDGGCYTAGVLIAKDDEGGFFIEHVVHGQWEPTERNRVMRSCAIRDRSKYGQYAPVIYVEAEGGSSGRDAWKGVVKALEGFYVKEDKVTGSKVIRAEPWSAQLAALNVFLISDDTWDLAGYIDEHVSFPFGKYCDQVDASSGGFNILSNYRAVGGLKVLSFNRKENRGKLCIMVVNSRESLLELNVDNKSAILLSFTNPNEESKIPQCSVPKLIDSTIASFAPIDPADYQEKWDDPIEIYNKKPEEVIFNKNIGMKIWKFLINKDRSQPELIILQDNGEGIALSFAYAIVDSLRLPRNRIYQIDNPEDKNEGDPPFPYLYQTAKTSKLMVLI